MNDKNVVIRLLLGRKRLLLTSGLVMALVAFGVSRMAPLDYYSEGSLIVQNPPSVNQGQPAAPAALSNVTTQLDVIRSQGLIGDVVQRLDLEHNKTLMPSSRLPFDLDVVVKQAVTQLRALLHDDSAAKSSLHDQTVKYVQEHLTATAQQDSSLITVGFVSGSPETSAMVANAVMEDYLKTINDTRNSQITSTNQWIQDQLHQSELGVDDAEANLNAFVRTHDTAQVQGSATAAIQVSEDEKALITAQQTLAEKQEALASVQHGNIGATHEALDSRSIEADEEMISKLAVQMANMASYDPRRPMLQHQVDSLRAHIAGETAMIGRSLNRDVQIAAATVRQLQHSLDRDKALAQGSSIDDATLRQLTADLEAKRQLLVAFQTQAVQVRGAAEQTPTASVMFHAMPPDRPAHQFGAISFIIGFIGGIAGMSGLVVMRSQMHLKMLSSADITALTGLRVVGSLPRMRHADLLAPGRTASMVTETFRSVWIRLKNEKCPVVLITSTEMGEGKTTVAETMARRFVGDSNRVLLVDGDMRHPRLGRLFNLEPVPVGRSTDPAKLVRQIDTSSLYVLPSQAADNPVRLLSSPWFAEFITACRSNYDFVIIDSPPIMAFPDATLLAELATNIVYVVQSGIPTDRVYEGIRRFSDEARQKMFTFMSKVPLGRLAATDYYRGYDKRRASR